MPATYNNFTDFEPYLMWFPQLRYLAYDTPNAVSAAFSLINTTNAGYYRFFIGKSCTLEKFRFVVVSVYGSPQTTNFPCELFRLNADGTLPGSPLATAYPDQVAVGVRESTFNYSISSPGMYLIRIRNTNPSPSSNYIQVHTYSATTHGAASFGNHIGFAGGRYTGSTSWYGFNFEIDLSGQTYGCTYTDTKTEFSLATVGNFIGQRLRLPFPAYLHAVLVHPVSQTASSSDTFRAELYDDDGNLISYGSDVNAWNVAPRIFPVATPIQLSANTWYRVGVKKRSGSAAFSVAIIDSGRTVEKSPHPITLSGSSWTTYPYRTAPISLLLEPIFGSGGSATPIPVSVLHAGVW